ncbi:MAG: S24/S26 family peptidase [Pseudomonadota bacterium]
MLRLFRVRGRSMLPTLHDGDWVVGQRSAAQTLRPGAIVCVQHRHAGWLIKRLGDQRDGHWRLDSDGQLGSESLGRVPSADIHYIARLVVGRQGLRWLYAASASQP